MYGGPGFGPGPGGPHGPHDCGCHHHGPHGPGFGPGYGPGPGGPWGPWGPRFYYGAPSKDNKIDYMKSLDYKGEGKNYKLTGNIYQASKEYKLVVDDFLVYDTSKYDKLKIDAYKVVININGMVVYSFTKGKEIEQENDKNEYIKYSQIISKINESDFVLQQFSSQEDSTGYLELFFVEGENSYTERFDFKNILQQSNNAFYYEKGKDESERTVK